MQLYATGAATATSAAQITIPTSTRIKGVHLAVTMDAAADNSAVALEFSKVPTNQVGSNGAQDPFLELRLYQNQGAAGQTQTGINQFMPLDVAMKAGDIIYLHATVTTATYYVTAIFSYA